MERRLDLDWIRIVVFCLLILYHVGMYYVSWDWHVKSPYAADTLEPLMMLSSPWRLSLLFLVSGVASAFLFEKTRRTATAGGRPARFLGPRSARLLLPLLFGMLVIVPPQSYYEVVEKLPGGYHEGYLAFWGRYLAADPGFCRDGDCLDVPTWNHLWFVAYLWVYTLIAWVLLRFAPRAAQRLGDGLERSLCALSGMGVLIWPAALLAVARVALVARYESTHALVDDWYNHAQYLPLFLLGVLVARREAVWDALQRHSRHALLAAMLGYGAVVWYFFGSGYDDATPPPDALRTAQRVIWAVFQWCAIAAILGYGRQLASRGFFRDTPTLRYLRDAVFPVYILHQSIIVVLAHNAQPLHLRPAVEGPLLVVATFALSFAGFEIVRRVRWLRPVFGLKIEQDRKYSPPYRRVVGSDPGPG